MRNCQICQADNTVVIDPDYQGYLLLECKACGHRFVDSPKLSQAKLDHYYLNIYKTDDKDFSDDRLNSLAQCIKGYALDHFNLLHVLDIGGTDGELQGRLEKTGVVCDVAGVENNDADKYGGVILSHTLEHVYDISQTMNRVQDDLLHGGYLFVEVPIHPVPYLAPLEYDYGWQHINKFRPKDLTVIAERYSFKVVESTALPDYVNGLHNRRYHCWRLVARYG